MNESRERVVALAAIMTEADCASSEYPFSDESRARAVLAAGYRSPAEVTALIGQAVSAAKAEAWDEGYGDDQTCHEPRTNPYRTAGDEQ